MADGSLFSISLFRLLMLFVTGIFFGQTRGTFKIVDAGPDPVGDIDLFSGGPSVFRRASQKHSDKAQTRAAGPEIILGFSCITGQAPVQQAQRIQRMASGNFLGLFRALPPFFFRGVGQGDQPGTDVGNARCRKASMSTIKSLRTLKKGSGSRVTSPPGYSFTSFWQARAQTPLILMPSEPQTPWAQDMR